jgi:glyoxylase-like metal-dependent hydrolase (beta-lactamase superfamily II)
MEKTRVGSVEVIALVDMEAAYPATAVYPKAGDALGAYRDRLDGEGRVKLNFGCFLLLADGRSVLVDAGWGPENGGRLPAEIAAAGLAPDDIDSVVFTHLHSDHTGWNLERTSGRPLFPKARYLVPRKDWEHYAGTASPVASFERDVRPLQALGCLDLIDGERILTPSLTAVATPGHTPGHTSVVIDSGGERGFILGDVVLSSIDAEQPEWENSFDWDATIARATRLAVLERLEREGALVGASHLPAPGLGRFLRAEGRRSWRAL